MNPVLGDVYYHDRKAAVVYWDDGQRSAIFEYTPEFIQAGISLSPLKLPLRPGPQQFLNSHESFSGMPGLLADCLPDTYGNTLIDEWLRQQGRAPNDFSPVERLCYIGSRGMGALAFRPSLNKQSNKAEKIQIDHLVELASQALANKESLSSALRSEVNLNEILRVGTSAGGARAKAIIALNPETLEVRSGQSSAPDGFEHWLLKFDGISEAFDGVKDPQGYGRIEFAYYLMATHAGIQMSECDLYEEGGRAHFMTRRFDRPDDGTKIHFASLFGLAHMAYTTPGTHSHSYEDYFDVIEKLKLPPKQKREAFRRMAFNVLACNRDDHTKNFGFLMSSEGTWKLSPAYDISYAYNPQPSKWTAIQQLSVLGKREHITRKDLIALGRNCSVATKPKLKTIIKQVDDAIGQWENFAKEAQVSAQNIKKIRYTLDLQK